MLEKIGNIEILIDNNRYYIVKGWTDESYNKILYNDVPIIDREISNEEYIIIKKTYGREHKLKRILKDDN
jgi:hypothetical protein